MGSDTLAIRTGELGQAKRYAFVLGLIALPVGVGLAIATDNAVAGLVIGAVGVAVVAWVWATSLRHAVILFDVSTRTITRVGPEGRTELGTFKQFTGVEVVGRIDEQVLEGTSLHEVHKTYPSKNVMKFEVCLVGPDGQVPVVTYRSKPMAIEVQQRIFDHCGFSHQSTSIPDARRLLE